MELAVHCVRAGQGLAGYWMGCCDVSAPLALTGAQQRGVERWGGESRQQHGLAWPITAAGEGGAERNSRCPLSPRAPLESSGVSGGPNHGEKEVSDSSRPADHASGEVQREGGGESPRRR